MSKTYICICFVRENYDNEISDLQHDVLQDPFSVDISLEDKRNVGEVDWQMGLKVLL